MLFLTRNKTKFSGELFLRYLAGYSLGRFFIEPLRMDQLKIPSTDIGVSVVLSSCLFTFCVVMIIAGRYRAAHRA
jgi:phosphatidylglycerol:prolipoprotein diacylglycerol transferase